MSRVQEGEQRVAIIARDGREKMIIAVNLPLEDADNALWIFPVPSTPAQVKLDFIEQFPRFFGRDPRPAAADQFYGFGILLRSTQLWLLPIDILFGIPNLLRSGRDFPAKAEVSKWGLSAEAVTVKSVEGLAAFLREKKVGIARDQLRSFEPYFSNRYALVVVRISSREQLLKEFPDYQQGGSRWPCVLVDFPTERAFYPLRPTSAYGDAMARVRLYVVGYVEPQTHNALGSFLNVGYYHSGGIDPDSLPRSALFLSKEFRYTTIVIGGKPEQRSLPGVPARLLTEDLWLVPANPVGVRFAEAVNSLGDWPFVSLPGWIALLSYLAAGMAGLSRFGRWRGYARLGLWNCLSLIAVAIASRRQPRDRWEGSEFARRTFVRRFTLFYIFLCLALELALRIPLGADYSGPIVVVIVLYVVAAGIWILFAEKRDSGRVKREVEWRRAVAALSDLAVVGATLRVVAWLLSIAAHHWEGTGIGRVFGAARGLWLISIIPFYCVYGALMEASSKQATLAKMATGVIVTDLEGKRLSFARAALRATIKLLPLALVGVGFRVNPMISILGLVLLVADELMLVFTRRKQALHDRLAGCLVIKKVSLPL